MCIRDRYKIVVEQPGGKPFEFGTGIEEAEARQYIAALLRPVSYTHLDVYKRQFFHRGIRSDGNLADFLSPRPSRGGRPDQDAFKPVLSENGFGIDISGKAGQYALCLLYTSRCV